jgi:hypothetical protein
MTDKQPEIFLLADGIELGVATRTEQIKAAAELRRLHEVNAELIDVLNILASWNDGEVGSHMDEPYAAFMARDAIAKATGEQQ